MPPSGGGGYRWHARESPAALPCSIYSGHLMAHLRAFPRARPGRGASASETWPLSFPLPSMMLWVIHSPDNAGANTGLLPSCRHRWTRNTKLQQLRESQPLNPLRARAKVVRVSHAHEMLNRIQSSPVATPASPILCRWFGQRIWAWHAPAPRKWPTTSGRNHGARPRRDAWCPQVRRRGGGGAEFFIFFGGERTSTVTSGPGPLSPPAPRL